jgi:hypothetical protein
MNVILTKDPSGTWERRKLPRLSELEGWQRLWVVTAAIYLLLLMVTGYVLMPDRKEIEKAMVFEVTEEVRRYDGLAFVGESPQGIFEAARKEGYANWISHVREKYRIGASGNAGFDRIDRKYHQALATLASRWMTMGVWLVIAWTVPMAVLYAMGYVVQWVEKGRGEREGH